MLGPLTAQEIEAVLQTEVIGRIGCVADGKPYIVPVTYVYDGEFAYVHSAEGMKVRAMRANPNVCFEVEQLRAMNDWRTAIASGRFEEIWRDQEERAMDLLATRFTPLAVSATARPARREDVHRREGLQRPVLYRIRLIEKTGRFERS